MQLLRSKTIYATASSFMLGGSSLMLFGLILFASCSDTKFKGGNADAAKPTPTKEPTIPSGGATVTPVPTLSTKTALPTPTPVGAITKGSFTVWTIPSDPQPKQDYKIYIEVKLPNNIGSYSYNDLSGRVIGTDAYVRDIGPNAMENKIPGWQDELSFNGTSATIVLKVPGAESLVKDVIQVKSVLLNEAQEIAIVF